MYIVPDDNMRCHVLVNRETLAPFNNRSYYALQPRPARRTLGELSLSQLDEDHPCQKPAKIHHPDVSVAVNHLVYDSECVSLEPELQLVLIYLTLTDNGMVDMLPVPYTLSRPEHVVYSKHQSI